jgi:hypothetical protein
MAGFELRGSTASIKPGAVQSGRSAGRAVERLAREKGSRHGPENRSC